MKAALAILLLVAIGFAAVMLVPALRGTPDSGMSERCKEDPRNCSPFAGRLDDATALWSAKIELEDWTLDGDDSRKIKRTSPKDGLRVARMRLVAGPAVVISYPCQVMTDDDVCPQSIALCSKGALLAMTDLGDVDKRWRNKRRAGNGRVRCRPGDEQGRLVIYSQGGVLQARAPLGKARLVFD